MDELAKFFGILWKNKATVIISVQAMIIVWSFAAKYYYLPDEFAKYKEEQAQKEQQYQAQILDLKNRVSLNDDRIRINTENNERIVLLLKTMSVSFANILKENKQVPSQSPVVQTQPTPPAIKKKESSTICKILTLGIGDC